MHLTWAEFLLLLKSPSSLYFVLGLVGFLGFVFWLMSTYFVAYFVDFAYLILPLFLLAPASTSISRDRESGFASILFTNPVSPWRHYVAKFLALNLIAGIYLLILVPFDLLIVTFAGLGWFEEILWRVLWMLIATSFVSGLGLLISASFGRRATLPSVFLGFATAMLLIFAPFLVIQYMGALDPDTISTTLALLHASPLMGAMDSFKSHGMVVAEPLLPVLLSLSLAVFLLLVGALVYSRFQSPEGWEVSPRIRLAILGIVVVVLLLSPLVPQYDYVRPQPSGSTCLLPVTPGYCIGMSVSSDGQFKSIQVDSVKEGEVGIKLVNYGPVPFVVENLSLRWRSEYFHFNVTSITFTSIVVPPSPGEQSIGVIRLHVPVLIKALRSSALSSSVFASVTPVIFELDANGDHFLKEDQNLHAVGREFNRDITWVVVLGLAMTAIGLRAFGRLRRD